MKMRCLRWESKWRCTNSRITYLIMEREREEEADLGAKELSFLYSLFSLSFLSNSSESTDLFRHTFIYIFIYISPRVLLSCIHRFKFYLCRNSICTPYRFTFSEIWHRFWDCIREDLILCTAHMSNKYNARACLLNL